MNKITKYLEKAPSYIFITYAIVTSFVTYSSMYAFRKPFASATFDNESFFGIDYKILLILFQAIGYMISKFVGIKFVSELKKENRAKAIITTILISWISLLFLAIVPKPYNIIFMFVNGLFLGLVWGFVFSYLEGRVYTEILGAGLSVSFIFSSGFVKTIGSYILQSGVPPIWMPFATGAVFVVPMVIFVYLLNKLPEPNENDISNRTIRKPMTGKERIAFFKEFSVGLVLLIIAYVLLTLMRDFRDNFAAEIWISLGYGNTPELFTQTEIPVSLAVLLFIGMLFKIKNNFTALITTHIIIIFGFLLLGITTFLFSSGLISPFLWITLTGMGLYFAYVPYNSMFFDRMIASFKKVANVGFLIYLADSFGYLASNGILIYKNFATPNISYLDFFVNTSYVVSVIGVIFVSLSIIYFYIKFKR